ncbi:hypothetical protein QVD17_35319 [Tagetes erecta]|uniref:Uncharacterized protein n=1 Tax=Tagetes erecta TaxID=13708 RepID=A0AAD8JZ97_TARER|nr:hypothetical protein QVD17_35319 [Tagetes erecta]
MEEISLGVENILNIIGSFLRIPNGFAEMFGEIRVFNCVSTEAELYMAHASLNKRIKMENREKDFMFTDKALKEAFAAKDEDLAAAFISTASTYAALPLVGAPALAVSQAVTSAATSKAAAAAIETVVNEAYAVFAQLVNLASAADDLLVQAVAADGAAFEHPKLLLLLSSSC